MFLVSEPSVKPQGSILLAHGSGAPMDTPFMNRAARALNEAGLRVYRYEFAYMAERRRSGKKAPPPRFEKLQQELSLLWESWEAPGPRYLGGKSLGSRVSVSLASQLGAAGAIALGYPFHPPAKPQAVRLTPFENLTCPVLIVQGSRDPFGGPDEVVSYALPAAVRVHWLAGATHDYSVRRSDPEPFEQLRAAVAAWLNP
ncbi:MAG: alpha/beta family hydrolase [Vulcanimicrobiota bacterium]